MFNGPERQPVGSPFPPDQCQQSSGMVFLFSQLLDPTYTLATQTLPLSFHRCHSPLPQPHGEGTFSNVCI